MKQSTQNPYKTRFSDASWAKSPKNVIIGGAGGIGSWLALYLARIGHSIHIFDPDEVNEVNLAGQLYGTSSILTPKVMAIAEIVQDLSGETIHPYQEKYESDSVVCPFMFSAFDNMEARKTMFENWASNEERELFVDGRMIAEVGMVYFVTKGNEDEYRKTLFSDSEVKEAPCSYKATSHCGAIIAGIMTSGLNNYIENSIYKLDIRKLPFKVDFQLPLLNFQNYSNHESITQEV
jgi:molybdopterin/thiamine biosynthesis adenylyltransferase